MKKNIFLFLLIVSTTCSFGQKINTVAGNGSGSIGNDNMLATTTGLGLVESSVALDTAGNIYIAVWADMKISKIDVSTGIVHTIAGTGITGYNGDGIPAANANLSYPQGVAVNKAGDIYIAEYGGYRIRKIDHATGLISTMAGTGTYGYNGDSIPATTAQTTEISGITLDTAENIIFSDMGNGRIRKVDITTGLIQTICGNGGSGYNGNGIPADTTHVIFPYGVAVDKYNNVYYAERLGQRVRRIVASGNLVFTIAGTGTQGYNGDGIAADTAQVYDPWGIAVDDNGNLYIADDGNQRVRMVDGAGIIHTVAGTGVNGFYGDGGLADTARLQMPRGICADRCGNLFVSDRGNFRIRKISSYDLVASFTNALCYNTCTGVVSASAIGGVGSYTYFWSGGLGTGSTHTNACQGTYVVTSKDANSCKENVIVTISQPAQLTASITPYSSICMSPGALVANPSGGTSPYFYSWSAGGHSYTQTGPAGNYTLTVTDSHSCTVTNTVTLSNTPNTINMSVSTVDANCASDGSATASAGGGNAPYTYAWSTGASSAVVNGLSAGVYTITASDSHTCTATQTFTINNASYPSAPICMVTVDSLSQYNVIMWDKTAYSNADSFIVLREISTNNYQRIGAVPYNTLSEFADTTRMLYFPNAGNPNTGTYRYKLQVRDTCGNLSLVSPYHNTIYFLNSNGNFYWTQLYTIENSSNPVSSYVLMRDDYTTGNWQPVSGVSGTQQVVSDPLYSIFQNTASWRVKTQWSITCSPTLRQGNSLNSGSFGTSYSNVYSNAGFGVKSNTFNAQVRVYPTLGSGIVTIEGPAPKIHVEVRSMIGELVFSSMLQKERTEINLGHLTKGSYFVQLLSEKGNAIRKIVIE